MVRGTSSNPVQITPQQQQEIQEVEQEANQEVDQILGKQSGQQDMFINQGTSPSIGWSKQMANLKQQIAQQKTAVAQAQAALSQAQQAYNKAKPSFLGNLARGMFLGQSWNNRVADDANNAQQSVNAKQLALQEAQDQLQMFENQLSGMNQAQPA